MVATAKVIPNPTAGSPPRRRWILAVAVTVVAIIVGMRIAMPFYQQHLAIREIFCREKRRSAN